MAITTPIKNKGTIKKAFAWLDKNVDKAFSLIYRIGTTSGLRITDITEIKWSDINFEDRTITIEENKGTRSAKARARLKVLEAWHKRLYQMERGNSELLEALFITKSKDLLTVIPGRYKSMIEEEIEQAVDNAKVKVRTVDLHPSLVSPLKQRFHKYGNIDGGYVFAKRTLDSNRARNLSGVVSRQACWAVFSKMGEAITDTTEKVKGSCHGMRKTFARMLYSDNGKDLNLVMQIMGWSNVAMVMRYLGFDEEQRKSASENVFESMSFV